MTILGTSFNKIVMEKLAPLQGKINIKTNANIKSVEKMDVNLGSKKSDAVKFIFEFTCDYQPDLAKILLEGDLVWYDKPEEVDKIIKSWKKDKKIAKEIMSPVLNTVLAKGNVEALVLSRELNLPPPIPLPKVEFKE